MRLNRRNVLVGLGTIVAGGGAALGTGAFSTVEADRKVTVDTAGDASALISLTNNTSYGVSDSDDTIAFDLSGSNWDNADGLNVGATTTLENALTIENNSDKTVEITSESSGASGINVRLSPSGTQLGQNSTDDSDAHTFDLEIEVTDQTAATESIDVTLTITATVTTA